jgi:DNA polymerase-3 subunit alpha
MAEADILRRAMSGKFRGKKEMERLEAKFFDNCRERNYPEEIVLEVWRQIASFAGYSFSKAHSASYAVESYQSLYLKTYYPVEFLVAVINNGGGFYSRELYFMQLQKMGVLIKPPCVNSSKELATIVDDEVYVGLGHIKGLQQTIIDAVLEDRMSFGPFLNLQNFIERLEVDEAQLTLLIQIGAFRFTGKTKGQLLWESTFLLQHISFHVSDRQPLFEEDPIEFELPPLPDDPLRDMLKELELLNFATGNIFDLVDADPLTYVKASFIPSSLGKILTVLGYLICTKDAATKEKQETMHFGTFVDVNLDWIDTVHFPRAANQFPFQEGGFYEVTGYVTEEFGVYAITVESMKKVGYKIVEC